MDVKDLMDVVLVFCIVIWCFGGGLMWVNKGLALEEHPSHPSPPSGAFVSAG
jgi:hypothetical protein